MAYSKAKLKSSGIKASPSLRPFWIRKLSDKYLPIQTFLECHTSTHKLRHSESLKSLFSHTN
jgi:hypothetical protein